MNAVRICAGRTRFCRGSANGCETDFAVELNLIGAWWLICARRSLFIRFPEPGSQSVQDDRSEIDHPQYGWDHHSLRPPDDAEEHGRDLYARASAGTVAPYEPTIPTVEDYQGAIQNHVDAVAVCKALQRRQCDGELFLEYQPGLGGRSPGVRGMARCCLDPAPTPELDKVADG